MVTWRHCQNGLFHRFGTVGFEVNAPFQPLQQLTPLESGVNRDISKPMTRTHIHDKIRNTTSTTRFQEYETNMRQIPQQHMSSTMRYCLHKYLPHSQHPLQRDQILPRHCHDALPVSVFKLLGCLPPTNPAHRPSDVSRCVTAPTRPSLSLRPRRGGRRRGRRLQTAEVGQALPGSPVEGGPDRPLATPG